MPQNPLLDDLQAGRPSLGLFANSADMIELCAFCGFRWVNIDQMFTANDWSRTEDLIRAAEAAGITPVVRLQSDPWLGYDHRIAVDASRAMGVGAQFMLVSNSGIKEIEECLVAAKGWHRKAITIHPYRDLDDWDRGLEAKNKATFVIPQPETQGGLDALEELIRRPDISIVFIAMTDASRILTGRHRPDFYNERLWEYVDRAVELGKQHEVSVGANTSYGYTMLEMRKRVEMLIEHGVKMIMAQSANFLFQVSSIEFMRELKPVLGQGS